jgi:hypothetical protein
MANSKLLKEAIADAKAVKETALANAKLALEEAFTPRLQSILSQKLRQEAEEEMGDEEMQNEELDSSDIGSKTGVNAAVNPGKQPSLDADTEFEGGVVKKSSANSANAVSDYTKTKDINEEEGMGMEDEKDQEIAELRARLAELEGGEPADDEMGMEYEGDDMGMGDDEMGDDDGEDYAITGDETEDTEEDDMDLESIIRELEAQLGDEAQTEEEPTEEESMYEDMADGSEAGTDKGEDPKVVMTTEEEEGEDKEDVIDLEEILREMEADMAGGEEKKEEEPVAELKANLKEAYRTIKSLQSTINEVNLLNAKLLFANKLFRAHNMTNEQKVKVIETLDRTKSVREVKLVYSTLAENFKYTTSNKVAKKSITEGFASKVVKSTKPAQAAQKQVIAESAVISDRFKKLAGIIK